MLDWAKRSGILLFLDSNDYQLPHSSYACLLAVGAADMIDSTAAYKDIERLQGFNDWIFGHICYDQKNELEPRLASVHPQKTGFPRSHFFIPQTVCYINKEQTTLTIESFDDPGAIYEEITDAIGEHSLSIPQLKFSSTTSRERYLDTIAKLRRHIADGDCYEINYCNEGFCEHAVIEPLEVFHALNKLSPAPFAAYYRLDDKYMMCASPERYLRREGAQILSQPIKGTARRDKDPVKDAEIKEQLRNDIKERAENVMIVDLVRNDLTRCCETGSIAVEELFGIYSFPQVHQMISTVVGTMKDQMTFEDAIRYTFPMGSMTGAPKISAMRLMEQYERSKRGVYSGAIGYFSPDNDFDFNVVIRTLLYNSAKKYLSFQAGSAITYHANAEQEYAECLLKAKAILEVLDQQIT